TELFQVVVARFRETVCRHPGLNKLANGAPADNDLHAVAGRKENAQSPRPGQEFRPSTAGRVESLLRSWSPANELKNGDQVAIEEIVRPGIEHFERCQWKAETKEESRQTIFHSIILAGRRESPYFSERIRSGTACFASGPIWPSARAAFWRTAMSES